MSRIKRGKVTRKRHKRLFKEAKGFWGQRKNVYRRAKETVLRAMAYAFKGRKVKKRSMRGLFIVRVSAGAQANGMNYNNFIAGLKAANIALDRKMLSQLAIAEPEIFAQLATYARAKTS